MSIGVEYELVNGLYLNVSSEFTERRSLDGYDFITAFDNDIPNLIEKYSKIVLPGVGSFKAGMDLLVKKKWNDKIQKFVKSGKYLFGICLGMQLLFKNGFEDGETEGLNLIEGSVTEMEVDKNLKLPHVGWNSLIFKKEHELFRNLMGLNNRHAQKI